MTLDPSAIWIVKAVFAMAVLTFGMGAWMSLVRMPAMKRAGLSLQDAAHTTLLRSRLPSSAVRVSDNYNHLFEAPTVFYAVAIAIAVLGRADPLYAACAWAFVVFRVAHSLVQATINIVALRATLYGLSWLALAVMIFRPLFTL